MSSQDIYDELIKSGLTKSELDDFFRQQKDFFEKSKSIRSRNIKMGLSPITPRTYTPNSLNNYIVRSGLSPQKAIKKILDSQKEQEKYYNSGTTKQITEVVNSSIDFVKSEFSNPSKIGDIVSSKIDSEDLDRLQQLNSELTRYQKVVESEAIPQRVFNAISDITETIKQEIYEILIKYI